MFTFYKASENNETASQNNDFKMTLKIVRSQLWVFIVMLTFESL